MSLQQTDGFLTSHNQCFDVCTCPSEFSINCDSRSLQSFPVFDLSAGFFSTSFIDLRLEHNTITEIPFGVFRNFTKFAGHNSLNIKLNHNHISRIHNGAFLGLERVRLALHLDNNELTSISHEFTRLTGLYELNIANNPLIVSGMQDDVIKQMFNNNVVSRISLSSYELLKKVMQYQRNTIYSLRMYDMNETGFEQGLFVKGQTTALKSLSMTNCAFGDFSEVLCNLDLAMLTLYECSNVNDTTLQGCVQNNTNSLQINDCNTTDAFDPSAFYNAPVTQFELWGNNINHVPRMLLNHWPNLTSITLGNHINSIQNEDFKVFTELVVLDIFSRNITFVGDEAFNTNLKLERLYIPFYTAVKLSPSIENLTHLETLQLPDMTCSCATMGALQGGNYSSMYITGNCKNIPGQSIKTYLNNDIISCS